MAILRNSNYSNVDKIKQIISSSHFNFSQAPTKEMKKKKKKKKKIIKLKATIVTPNGYSPAEG